LISNPRLKPPAPANVSSIFIYSLVLSQFVSVFIFAANTALLPRGFLRWEQGLVRINFTLTPIIFPNLEVGNEKYVKM